MNTKFLPQLIKLIATAALVVAPLTSNAIPITYDIGAGTSGNFSGSFLHKAAWKSGMDGYYMSGDAASMSGTLTYDLVSGKALGSITGMGEGRGMFNKNDLWTLTWTGVSQGEKVFNGGIKDLLSLDYDLSNDKGHSSQGTFYFADKTFTGSVNSITPDNLLLWGLFLSLLPSNFHLLY